MRIDIPKGTLCRIYATAEFRPAFDMIGDDDFDPGIIQDAELYVNLPGAEEPALVRIERIIKVNPDPEPGMKSADVELVIL